MVGVVFVIFALFYLVHKRELDRFSQQNNVVKKEQQVSHVLNSQTDSILVVEKIQEDQAGKQSNDEETAEVPIPRV